EPEPLEQKAPLRGPLLQTASFAALTGLARTIFRAGLALNIISSPVNGLVPFLALVAGFLTTTNLAKPGTRNTPAFFSSLWPTPISLSMTFFTSRLESSVAVAIFSTNCDLDIWVAIVSPLIRTDAILDRPASVWSHSAQICWHFEAAHDELRSALRCTAPGTREPLLPIRLLPPIERHPEPADRLEAFLREAAIRPLQIGRSRRDVPPRPSTRTCDRLLARDDVVGPTGAVWSSLRGAVHRSPTGGFAHARHAQIARRVNLSQIGAIVRYPKSAATSRHPALATEGRIAIVTDVGCGMRWTRQRRARQWQLQGGSLWISVSDAPARRRTRLKRTAKPCGPDIRCWCQVRGGEVGPTGLISLNPWTTVTRRIRRRGERAISR